jgi:hypothetical protein
VRVYKGRVVDSGKDVRLFDSKKVTAKKQALSY